MAGFCDQIHRFYVCVESAAVTKQMTPKGPGSPKRALRTPPRRSATRTMPLTRAPSSTSPD